MENHTNQQDNPIRKIDWSSLKRTAKRIVIWTLVIAVLLCGALATMKIAMLESQLKAVMQEREAVQITNVRVRDRLLKIGDLSTAEYEYEDTRTIEDARELWGWTVPGTTNSVTINYCGVVKMGYDVSQIVPSVDPVEQIITVRLPEPVVKDNYIKLDGFTCTTSNNLLNPIELEDMATYFAQFEDEALAGAEYSGIYELAEEQMQLLVRNFLAVFPDYKVVFL